MSTNAIEITKKPSLLQVMADERSISPQAFLEAIRSTVFPKEGTQEQLIAFLLIANKYKLEPLLKEIYAFPSKGGIQPIVGVDGWTAIVNRQAEYDGVEFVENFNKAGDLMSITAKIHRKDRALPTVVTEYLMECRRDTEPWKKWPIRMLRHKAFIQCARLAFSISGVVDDDEAVRINPALGPVIDQGLVDPVDQEIDFLFGELRWPHSKRTSALNQYGGRKNALLEYLQGEHAKAQRFVRQEPQTEAEATGNAPEAQGATGRAGKRGKAQAEATASSAPAQATAAEAKTETVEPEKTESAETGGADLWSQM
jgi:phage recombination protein Bet